METLERKLANDATDKVKGILYQLYAALQYCFELLPGEVLYIEKFGDITISNLQQIEVKNYSNALTDTHDNLWKTIYNWCSKDFDPKLYKNLILLTTQKIGKNSKFINWNEKNTNEKFDIIHQITSEYCKKIIKDN